MGNIDIIYRYLNDLLETNPSERELIEALELNSELEFRKEFQDYLLSQTSFENRITFIMLLFENYRSRFEYFIEQIEKEKSYEGELLNSDNYELCQWGSEIYSNDLQRFLTMINNICRCYNINFKNQIFEKLSFKGIFIGYEIEETDTCNELNNNGIVLNWHGQNNVLTDIFREMKNKKYLANSIPEVAIFLKSNFDCFKNTKLSTVEGMLKNNNSSANSIPREEKRIQIPEKE